jgi:hypothetical protein
MHAGRQAGRHSWFYYTSKQYSAVADGTAHLVHHFVLVKGYNPLTVSAGVIEYNVLDVYADVIKDSVLDLCVYHRVEIR